MVTGDCFLTLVSSVDQSDLFWVHTDVVHIFIQSTSTCWPKLLFIDFNTHFVKLPLQLETDGQVSELSTGQPQMALEAAVIQLQLRC